MIITSIACAAAAVYVYIEQLKEKTVMKWQPSKSKGLTIDVKECGWGHCLIK